MQLNNSTAFSLWFDAIISRKRYLFYYRRFYSNIYSIKFLTIAGPNEYFNILFCREMFTMPQLDSFIRWINHYPVD